MKWKYIISILIITIGVQIVSGKEFKSSIPKNKNQLQIAVKGIDKLDSNYTSNTGTAMSSTASIQTISGTITYSPAINPVTYTINTGLEVGKTPGNMVVGGSAGYSIPIEVPAGPNGMQPSVSLNYASSFADGLMGIGWNIGGMSSITRTNETIYNDGISDPVRGGVFGTEIGDMTDKYSIDGKRMVTISGSTYGARTSVYGTEIEEFSKIIGYGATGQGPQWFKVYSKSGLIYEYGNTSDSKLMGVGTCILTWKLNRISDRYNNSISFSYLTTDDELPIDKIEYTGNGSQFAQVLFNYKTRADVSYYVYGGKQFTRDILLDNVEVKNNGLTYKKYVLDYMKDTFAQLQKVTPYSSQNVALNPTVFAWTDQTEIFTQTPNYTSSDDELLYTGDFNGDGRDDLVTAPNKASYTTSDKWKLYLADASGNLSAVATQGDLNTAFEGFIANDFDGDGLTDLMMQEKHPDSTYPDKKYYYFYQSTGLNFTRNSSYYLCYDNKTLDVVDYNGDGKLEFMIHNSINNWFLYTYLGVSIYSASIPSFGESYYIENDKMSNRIVDFNGDGCSDLLVLFSNSYKVYEFKGINKALVETYSGTNIKNNDFLLFGDYNGDGSIDIFQRVGPLPGDASYILTLTSGGFQSKSQSYFNVFDIYMWNNKMYAHDMDGDGRTDIVMVGRGTNTGNSYNRIRIALSRGNDFSVKEYISTTTMVSGDETADRFFNFADFNGDGRTELFYKYSSTSNLFSFASGTPSHLINTVIDGLGTKTSLTYLPMSNSNVYTRGTGATYPVSDFSSSMQLVSQISTDNGIGGITSLNYTYAGAKMHLQGKGFLGFFMQTTTDLTTGLNSSIKTYYDPTYYYPQVHYVVNNSTGESVSNTWGVKVLDATNKRIFPFVAWAFQNNSLTQNSISLSTNVDSYGNPIQVTKYYTNGPTETTRNTYSSLINTNDWLVGRIDSSKVTYSKLGETDVSKTVRYTYFTDGIVKPDVIYYNEGTPLEYYKNYDYDSKGNPTQLFVYGASIGSSQTNYTYDSNGVHVLTSTDALGHTSTSTYDPNYDRLLSEKDYLNNTNTYGYDTSDRPFTISGTIGNQITTTYAWTGTNKPTLGVYGVTKTGNDGSVSTVWYDKLGRILRIEKKGFSGTMILTDTQYNTKGQVYQVSDPYFTGGSVVWAETYTYDAYGRTIAIARNVGRNTTYSYPGATVSETTAGKTFSKTYNSDGTLSSATDNGGAITYAYFPDGKAKTITTGGVVTSMLYADAARNQTQLIDPNAGTVNYTYDSFGRIKTQTDARGKMTTNTYLPDGRTDNVVNPEGTTTYSYNTNKQLTGISSPGSVSRTYGYDPQGRVNNVGENIAGSAFSTSFTFDSFGRLALRTHPSGIIEIMHYNNYGYMDYISAGGAIRFTITAMNAREQLTGSTYGSNLTATYGFDANGYPSSSNIGTIQDYRYSFDPLTGNLNSRENFLKSKSESFTYDNLDRLLTVTGPQPLTMTYNANGNINTKSDIGTTASTYGTNAGPNALTTAYASNFVIPGYNQTASYNSLGKVNTISESDFSAAFIYNADHQRAKMDVTIRGANMLTRWYVGGSYMKETASGVTKEYTYIGGDAYTAPVAAVTQTGVTTYYYLLRDHLGSITHQVNTSNTVVAEFSYDAWGRRRNATNWSYTLDANDKAMFADRGFTGHEYLSWFNLYNMNGRLYDPLVGRFLSPDPYVQDPGNSQSYNRYAYCLNNPLKYTDHSGYTWWSHFTNWVGENKSTILTVAYLVTAAVVTVICPGAGLAMFGAYLGGSATNGWELNIGKWDYSNPGTYVGIIGGALVGGLGGQLLFGTGGVFAGGTTVDLSLSATYAHVATVFANFNISAAGISLADVGYATVAGGGVVITAAAIKNLFNNHGIDGAYPTNDTPSSWNNVTYTSKGSPETMRDMVNSNENHFNASPTAADWVNYTMWGIGGITLGHYVYSIIHFYDDIPSQTTAPTTTDKTPQIGPEK